MSLTVGLEIYAVCTTIGLLVVVFARREKPTDDGLLDRLLPLLVQYPTVRQGIEWNPGLPAAQVIPLFGILDKVISYWHLEPIGVVGQSVDYDPQLHQPDSGGISRGERVYVRYVGYRSGEKILAPAKVSRQLPKSSNLQNISDLHS